MDPRKMMKQVQKMQAQIQQAQAELAEKQVEGTAGGGAVKVTLTGSGEVSSVNIDPSAIDPEDPSLLEDLVVAAFNDAQRAQQELTEETLGPLTGGMDLPGL